MKFYAYFHGRRTMCGQTDIPAYFLKRRGRLAFCSPPPFFLGVDILIHSLRYKGLLLSKNANMITVC